MERDLLEPLRLVLELLEPRRPLALVRPWLAVPAPRLELLEEQPLELLELLVVPLGHWRALCWLCRAIR